MKKTVLRVYDENEKYTNYHECYFLVLPEDYDDNNDYHYQEYIFPRLAQIAGMKWQSYTSYIIGTADIKEEEMVWSEITNYELYEVKIHISRVKISGTYDLPECITWSRF